MYCSSTVRVYKHMYVFLCICYVAVLIWVQGITVRSREQPVRITVHVPAVVADMPAKAMVRNAINFNGKFGCSLCTMEGKSVPSGAGHCRAYIQQPGENIQCRTHLDTLQHAKAARLEQIPVSAFFWEILRTIFNVIYDGIWFDNARIQVFGIKGMPRISSLDGVNYSRCFLLDEMHCFLLGITKKRITLWMESTGQPYSLTKEKVTLFINYTHFELFAALIGLS